MNGCNKPYNGEHKVEGSSLRCGNKLLWKTADNNRERTLEIILCEDCKLQDLVNDTTEEEDECEKYL